MVLRHKIPTGGRTYLNLCFALDDLTQEQLTKASFLCRLLGSLGAADHGMEELHRHYRRCPPVEGRSPGGSVPYPPGDALHNAGSSGRTGRGAACGNGEWVCLHTRLPAAGGGLRRGTGNGICAVEEWRWINSCMTRISAFRKRKWFCRGILFLVCRALFCQRTNRERIFLENPFISFWWSVICSVPRKPAAFQACMICSASGLAASCSAAPSIGRV